MTAARRRRTGLWSGAAAGVAGALLTMAAALVQPTAVTAQTLLTQEEALALAFPAPTRVERRTAYLSDAQLRKARALAGSDVDIEQAVVTYYVGYRGDRPVGVAYFEAHRVRTMAEVVMAVVTPDGRLERMDVLKFMEPPEYRAPAGWVAQLEGRPLDDDLSLSGSIRNLTGATLTARALTRAARRLLALHAVIQPTGAP